MSGQELTPESVRAAYPKWQLTLSWDGYWTARLTTTPKDEPAPRVTGGTLRELVQALNEYLAICEVLSASEPYADRGHSLLCRVYVEIRLSYALAAEAAPPAARGRRRALPAGGAQ